VKLELFSSKKGIARPNLVAIQAADLDMLPTVLVCPLLPDEILSAVRAQVMVDGREYIALCDLARPVNRRILVKVGELSEADSQRIMQTFRLLLAE
jgi:hypothetical protein